MANEESSDAPAEVTETERMVISGKRLLVECPHCHKPVLVVIKVEVVGAFDPEKITTPDRKRAQRTAPTTTLLPHQEEMVMTARENGLFDAFAQVASKAKNPAPKRMKKFFVHFFQCAQVTIVPRDILQAFIDEFDKARIEIWVCDGLAAVTADGVIKRFVPQSEVAGQKRQVDSLDGRSGTVRRGTDEEGIWGWRRTRFGYAAGAGAFFQEMQRQSFGEFQLRVHPRD